MVKNGEVVVQIRVVGGCRNRYFVLVFRVLKVAGLDVGQSQIMYGKCPSRRTIVRFPEGFPIYAGLAGINLVPARVFDTTSFRSAGGGMNGTAPDMLKFVESIRTGGAPVVSRDTATAMMTIQTGDLPIVNRGPGWAFGYGGSILIDPAAALTPTETPGLVPVMLAVVVSVAVNVCGPDVWKVTSKVPTPPLGSVASAGSVAAASLLVNWTVLEKAATVLAN